MKAACEADHGAPLNEFVFVDDDKLTLEIVSWIVKRSGYRTRLFMDADEALAYLKQATPRLLVVDFYMPGITGLEFIQKLRESIDLSLTQIYVCSAMTPQNSTAVQFTSLNVGILEKQVVCDKLQLTRLLQQYLVTEIDTGHSAE